MSNLLDLAAVREQYRRDLFEDYLPFHERFVVDREYGGFMCWVRPNGERVSTNKKMWFEGRGVWVFSFLYNHLAREQKYLDIAERSLRLIERTKPKGLDEFWPKAVSREGEPIEPADPEIYSDMFVAEGMAEFSRATGEQTYWEQAREIVLKCERKYDRPDYFPEIGQTYLGPGAKPFPGARVGGAWMVLLRLTGQLLNMRADTEMQRISDRAIEALLNHHMNPRFDLMNELINHDFSRPADEYEQLVYTGHAIEILWMLMDEAVRRGDHRLFDRVAPMFRRHCEVAQDRVYGGILRALLKVDGNQWALDKTLYPQQESLIGAMLWIEQTGDSWATNFYAELDRYTRARFPMRQLGSPLWQVVGNRQVNLDHDMARAENYHHPRFLMLNLLAVERMIAEMERRLVPSDGPSELLIGAASEVITPEPGCPLAGFAARKGVATRVHDDLHARALVFDDRKLGVALVSVEVIALSRELAMRIRREVEKRTGIPAANTIVAATHTHCGPVTLNHFFNPGQPLDESYLDRLVDRTAACAAAAFATRRPRRIRTGFASATGIAVNRRTADGLPADPQAGVLLIEDLDGQPAAIAVNFACHPTVLGPDTLDITGDFPFFSIDRLRKTYPSAEALYFNGAEGDLSIGHRSDLSAIGYIAPFRTFAKAEELGLRLADAVIDALPGLDVQEPVLAVETRRVELPLKMYAGRRTATTETPAQLRDLFNQIEDYYEGLYGAEPGPEPKTLSVELAAIRIGNTAILTFPGEVFVEIALAIRGRSPFPATLFLGLANDYIGYVPTANANAAAGYEVAASRVAPEAAAILEEASVALLQDLYNSEIATAF